MGDKIPAEPASHSHGKEHEGHNERPLQDSITQEVAGQSAEDKLGYNPSTTSGKKAELE
jgi:hypothetical protein